MKGENVYNAKLTQEAVFLMRVLYPDIRHGNKGFFVKLMSMVFDCHPNAIKDAIRGKSYR